MSYQNQPSTLDFLKLIGLLVVIGVVAFDIFFVRSKNKELWKTIEIQKKEMDDKIKSIENEKETQDSRYKQELKDVELRASDAKEKAKAHEDELTGKIKEMEDRHSKELDELRTSYEKKVETMRVDFDKEKERLQADLHLTRKELSQKKSGAINAESVGDDGINLQNQTKKSMKELKRQINANLEEIKRLRDENPACILVPSHKQARILETRVASSRDRRYTTKSDVTYVRDMFRCTACNREFAINEGGPCCRVSAKRSFALWRGKRLEADKTVAIGARIDALLAENEMLKKELSTNR